MYTFWKTVSAQVLGVCMATVIIGIASYIYRSISMFLGSSQFYLMLIAFCIFVNALLFSIHAYRKVVKLEEKLDDKFESTVEGFKAFEKSISDIVDLVEKNREYMEERFKQFYEEINKKQDKHP